MRVVLFGATGMVGEGVLIECLDDPRVEAILAVTRRPLSRSNEKLTQLVRENFYDYRDLAEAFRGYDACFFCLGVSAVGLREEQYRRLTYDLTIAAAESLAAANPGMVFCYITGQGTDSSEAGRSMWARVKGATENQLLRMPLDAYMFRPGFIEPMKGVRSKTRLYQTLYDLFRFLLPLINRFFAKHLTTSENVGRAMIEVAAGGYETRILGPGDINRLAARGRAEG